MYVAKRSLRSDGPGGICTIVPLIHLDGPRRIQTGAASRAAGWHLLRDEGNCPGAPDRIIGEDSGGRVLACR